MSYFTGATDMSPGLKEAFARAEQLALIFSHEHVTFDHLIATIVDEPSAGAALDALGANRTRLYRRATHFIEHEMPPNWYYGDASDRRYADWTQLLLRTMKDTRYDADELGFLELSGARMLTGIIKIKESHASYLLKEEDITKDKLDAYIKKYDRGPRNKAYQGSYEAQEKEEHSSDGEDIPRDSLEAYTLNLNTEARMGRIEPLIGRKDEVDRVVRVLCRHKKNTPMLVGEPGVGKTAIAEGLAHRICKGLVPEKLMDQQIFGLNMGALVAGTRLRGQFEKRLQNLIGRLENMKDAILFIDEAHTIIGAGQGSGSLDASHFLKPLLVTGRIRCIGATTFEGYKRIEKDAAMARRFHRIEVPEPSIEETVAILRGLRPRYQTHHSVTYTDEALSAAAHLADKHLTERFLPDKAIDVVDEAGAEAHMNAQPSAQPSEKVNRKKVNGDVVVDVADIEIVVSKMARAPVESVTSKEKELLRTLPTTLKNVLFGQDEAVDKLVSAIFLSRAGLRAPGKPVGSFLFAGPTGVGKTELSKQLAKALGVKFLRFDMSEYNESSATARLIGAAPGYRGFDQGGLLTDAVRKHPHSVVVLDEIEKAHPDVWNILLQVMDHAGLTDNTGREADFRNIVLIMTSNAGVREGSEKVVGFGSEQHGELSKSRTKAALERTFAPELRNRFDAIVYFDALKPDVLRKVVHKELGLLGDRLQAKNTVLQVSKSAHKWLMEHGYDPDMGARPLARLIEQHIAKPLAETLLFEDNDLNQPRHVKVTVKKDELALTHS